MKKLIYTLVFCFNLFCEQIDVVIPVHKKDAPTIDVVINAVRKNIINLRDVYVISKEQFTDNAIWIAEEEFPFSISDVGNELGRIGVGTHVRRGWYYQQLLKFYAHRVIDGLSSSFLILDADTCPNHPMVFVEEDGRTYLDHLRAACFRDTYYAFMTAMVPSIDDVDREVNPVVHHMVFNHGILDDLFERVEKLYKEPFWKAFAHLVPGVERPDGPYFYAGASEYILYFFFCQFYHQDKIINRVIEMEHKAKSLSKEYGEKYDFICKHNYDRT